VGTPGGVASKAISVSFLQSRFGEKNRPGVSGNIDTVSEFLLILSPRVDTLDFGRWLVGETSRLGTEANEFFGLAYTAAGFPLPFSAEDEERALALVTIPRGPNLTKWLDHHARRVALRALAWSSRFAHNDDLWCPVSPAAAQYLLSICGVEADTEPARIDERTRILRRVLGSRQGGWTPVGSCVGSDKGTPSYQRVSTTAAEPASGPIPRHRGGPTLTCSSAGGGVLPPQMREACDMRPHRPIPTAPVHLTGPSGVGP